MASSAYGGHAAPPTEQTRAMIAHTKTLLNSQLKHVLSVEGLRVSGVKSDLQIRIISHIEQLVHQGDDEGLQRVRRLLYGQHNDFINHNSSSPVYNNYTPPASASPQYHTPTPSYGHKGGMSSHNAYPKQLAFRDSPFYQIKAPLTSVIDCKARESTRDTVRANINLPSDVVEQLNRDPTYRVMVFCAADAGTSTPAEISFPHQVELKCNTNEVKANLRGLKNKLGSTRPADITSFIKKKVPGYQNVLEMVYALTNKKYFLVVNLVRKVPIDDLVAQLKHGKAITKERVIKEMTSKADDNDIQATSSVLSLKCPLSATRMVTPCRSTSCTHNQCFDAASYLMLQEQAPQWTCPLCNRSAPFTSLTIDLYVDNILKSTSTSTEQVTIEPNGSWLHQKQTETPQRPYNNPTPDHDDDDLVEIQDNKMRNPPTDARLGTLGNTTPTSSREPSSVPSGPRSNKRPISEVIDLTNSDDEDEGLPQKIIKRPSMPNLSSTDPYQAPSASRYSFNLPSTYSSDCARSPS